MNESSDTATTRAILAHTDPTVRKALRDLLIQGLEMEVIGEAADAATLRAQVEAESPDLVIVAWRLVATDAAGMLGKLRGPRGDARLVVIGARPDKRPAALAAGADGYVSMVDAPDVVAGILRPAQAAAASHDSTTQRRSGPAGGERTHEPGGLS